MANRGKTVIARNKSKSHVKLGCCLVSYAKSFGPSTESRNVALSRLFKKGGHPSNARLRLRAAKNQTS